MKLRPRARGGPSLPLEGLAGVALLLLGVTLVIGLVTAPRGFALERSAGELGSLPPLERTPVFLRMLPDASLQLEGRPVSRSELISRIRTAFEPMRETVIVLEATDDVPYEAVVAVCDALSWPELWSGMRPPVLSLPTHQQIAEYARAYGRDPFEALPPSP